MLEEKKITEQQLETKSSTSNYGNTKKGKDREGYEKEKEEGEKKKTNMRVAKTWKRLSLIPSLCTPILFPVLMQMPECPRQILPYSSNRHFL